MKLLPILNIKLFFKLYQVLGSAFMLLSDSHGFFRHKQIAEYSNSKLLFADCES